MKLTTLSYNRQDALSYARRWALKRNPFYYNYDNLGGDCTNFASQCLFSGCKVMNYTPTLGWYYINGNNKSPSWTGVPYFYNFLVNNKKEGPFGLECPIDDIMIGDFIQLGADKNFYHTLFVVDIDGAPNPNNIYIATHTLDSYNRPLSSYFYTNIRYIHIAGVRKWL
ncbi:MAG: amidase domain-containing protein [Clostridiales bacterium]|nr:amidase domain-containing protein [Clostridiales bacterium]